MTDREMLELAARAAGYDVDIPATGAPRWRPGSGGERIFWNSLNEGGDALRLAIALRLTVCIGDHSVIAGREEGRVLVQVPYGPDGEEAAAFRAITGAAAEIARMQGAIHG